MIVVPRDDRLLGHSEHSHSMLILDKNERERNESEMDQAIKEFFPEYDALRKVDEILKKQSATT